MLKIRQKSMSVNRWVIMGCLTFILAARALIAADAPFSRIVVFGTSLSDPGNAFALLGATNVPPDYSVDPFLVPDRPYARGGQHFSNGPTWSEQFGKSVGLGQSVQPAFRSSSLGATTLRSAAPEPTTTGSMSTCRRR